MPGEKRFIIISTIPGLKDEEDPWGHGSCVTSKVAGPKFGVAKKANIVMVKMPLFLKVGNLLDCLTKISDDVFVHELGGKAVINLSAGCKYINFSIGELVLTLTLGNIKFF